LALCNEPGEDELDAPDAANAGESMDLSPGEPSGRARENLDDRSIECRDDAADRVRDVHD
jgi:hypothetical protein